MWKNLRNMFCAAGLLLVPSTGRISLAEDQENGKKLLQQQEISPARSTDNDRSLGGNSPALFAFNSQSGDRSKSSGGRAQKSASDKKPAAWYDSLKGIPLGPGTLDIGINIRTRYEYTDNFNVRAYGTARNDNLILLRSRLILDYHMGKPAHVYIEMQDARYSSENLKRSAFTGSNPFYDATELRQAYMEWERMGGSPAGFKVGRQSITYGDRRVFGPGEWGNVGRYWWDAAKFYWHTDLVKVDMLYGRQIVSEPATFNEEHNPFQMGAVYAQFKQFKKKEFTFKPDVFYIGRYDTHGNLRGESGTGDEMRHTLGFRANGKMGAPWDYNGTIAAQFGSYGKDDIKTFGAVAGAGYTFKSAWTPRVGAEFAYAGGDDNPQDGTRGTFDNVYGAADAYYYGWMNVTSWVNLVDYQLSFTVNPNKKLKLWTEYNYFRLASAKDAWYYGNGKVARRDATGQAGKDLGHEINLLGQWKISKLFEFLGGYGGFLGGKFRKNTPGGNKPAHWIFLQLTFTL